MNANLCSLFWEGFVVNSFSHPSANSLLIQLQPDAAVMPCCRRCERRVPVVHDVSSAECVNASCLIGSSGSTSPSGACVAPLRGHHRKISWLPERQRYTTTLSVWVESLVRLLPIKHVAQLTGLHWHTVKNIDYRRLLRERTEPQRHTLRRLVMDEFALFKGHRYATVVMDADTQQVLWVGEGRSRAAFRPFFWLGAEGCAAIQSVAMDMNTALDLEVRHHPQAEVVYDLFHVVAKYGREVIDRVRVDQANQLRDNPKSRQVIKRSRWLLLRNRNLPEGHEVKLTALLEANQPLNVVWLMKTTLKELWYAPSEQEAQRRWTSWYRQSQESGIKALQHFAETERYAGGIIARVPDTG